MANIIQKVQKPTLVLAHNKTLAGQLYSEFKEFFPENNVEYFVSYYDYYQPEAYIPQSDTYIEKDSSVNDEIDKLRHSATAALFETRDVIIVASVSCIYGLGDPIDYENLTISLRPNMKMERNVMLKKLVNMQYTRSELEFKRGSFRAKGDIVEIYPSGESETAIRVEFWGEEIEKISEINPLTGKTTSTRQHVMIFPNSHYATTMEKMEKAIVTIEKERDEQVKYFKENIKKSLNLEVSEDFIIKWLEYLGKTNGANPKVNKVLEYLSSKYELVVLTNWFQECQAKRLESANMLKYFKEVIGGDKYIKPNPNSYLTACGPYRPDECLMIGDNLELDVLGALNAGLQAIYLSNSQKPGIRNIKNLEDLKNIL